MTEKALVSKNHEMTQEALLIDIGLIRWSEKVAFLSLSGFLGQDSGNVSLQLRLTRRQKNKLHDDT